MPVFLAVYYFLPVIGKNILLLLASLLFYAWGSPAYLAVLLFSVVFNYFSAAQISFQRRNGGDREAKIALITSVIFNVALLGFYKYTGFLFENINTVLGTELRNPVTSLPIGISFYTFSALSYIIDIYRGRAKFDKNPLVFGIYLTMFAKISSGPIVRFEQMRSQIFARKLTKAKLYSGLYQFTVGLSKKVLIADNLAVSFQAISGMAERSAVTAWLGMIFYSLELYFDFSGYSDMAIGLAKMMGFKFDANFNYPYLSESITEFWRRWHISLGGWFREYVYIPLGGNRCSAGRQVLNLLVVWLLTGIWHGAAWNFVFWGLYHGAIVLLEKFALKNITNHIPRVIRIAVTVLLAFVGWVFFFSPNLTSAFGYIGQMFGTSGIGVVDSTALYYLRGNLVLLILAVLCCGPLPNDLWKVLCYRKSKAVSAVTMGLMAALFMICVAGIVGATNTTFLYFNF